jgi:hypothetical protein
VSISDIFKSGPATADDVITDAKALALTARDIAMKETSLSVIARQNQDDLRASTEKQMALLLADEDKHAAASQRANAIADALEKAVLPVVPVVPVVPAVSDTSVTSIAPPLVDPVTATETIPPIAPVASISSTGVVDIASIPVAPEVIANPMNPTVAPVVTL